MVYSWEKEGETLPDEVFADLQMPPVSRTDAGNYTCVAANSFGLTRETGQLIVQCECPGGQGVWSAAVGVVGDGKGCGQQLWAWLVTVVAPVITNVGRMLYLCVVCAKGKGGAPKPAHMMDYMFCSDFQLHFRFGSGGCVPASNCSGWWYSICASGL